MQRNGDETRARLTEWLDARAGGRFFAFLHLFEPHSPYALLIRETHGPRVLQPWISTSRSRGNESIVTVSRSGSARTSISVSEWPVSAPSIPARLS